MTCRPLVRKPPLAVLAAAIVLLSAAPAPAQGDGGPDPSTVRVHFGPLMMNPMINISNIGIDHNVFNDPPSKSPKQDFTVTVTPLTDFWLHLGPTWVTASLNESINWYQKYASERTANTEYKLGWNVPGSRMSLKANGAYRDARERPGFEIDTRAARKESEFTGAYEYHALSTSYIGATASRRQTRFAGDAVYLDTNLQLALNRVTTAYGLNVRHQLSSLTSVSFGAVRSTDRFEFSPARDTASTSAQMSMTFEPAALMKGGLSIGYTDFRPLGGDVPGYRGLTGAVDLVYVLLGSTRFAINGGRGVQYSYDINQPYYVQTRIGGSVAQEIFGPLDVQVRADVASLAYRSRAGVQVAVPDRNDRVTSYGIGVGFHIGKDLRLSFNIDQNDRDTRVTDHQYEKFLIGTALTYGF